MSHSQQTQEEIQPYVNTITGLPSNYAFNANSHSNHTHRPQRKLQEFIKTDRGKLMVFIDGSNLLYTAKMMGLDLDYIRLVDVLVGKDKLIRVNFYAGIDNDNLTSVGWQTFMKRTGFKMTTKQVVSYSDGKQKANCDVEMAVDMIHLAHSYDTAILVTGDGDLSYAAQTLMNMGKQVEVYGYRQNTSETLINTVDRFIDIDTIRQFIQKNTRQFAQHQHQHHYNNNNNNNHYNNNYHAHPNQQQQTYVPVHQRNQIIHNNSSNAGPNAAE